MVGFVLVALFGSGYGTVLCFCEYGMNQVVQ